MLSIALVQTSVGARRAMQEPNLGAMLSKDKWP